MAAPSLAKQVQGVGSVSADNCNTFLQTCDNVVQLRGFVGTSGMEVLVRGLAASGDGGSGTFYWSNAVTQLDDGVNYIVPPGSNGGGWIRSTLSGAFGLQVSIASGATTDIGSVGSNYIYVTGTTTITSFGSSAKVVNPTFLLRFQSALTVKNSANIITPNNLDITTTVNGLYLAVALGSGVFIVTPFSAQTASNTLPGFGSQNSISSAGTTDLGSITTHNVLVTGTTTITSFGSSASATAPIYLVQFSGALTLTYNAVSMILIGSANVTTAANDVALMQYLGSGNWQMLTYQKFSGAAPVTTAILKSQIITSSGTFTIPTGISSASVFKFTAVGGGGGGGGVPAIAGSSGAGGESGHYVIGSFSGFSASTTVTITIGNGGAAATGISGSAGGNTLVTYNGINIIVAVGGVGGLVGLNGTSNTKGAISNSTSNVSSAGTSGLTLVSTNVNAGSAPSWSGGVGLVGTSSNFGGYGGSTPLGAGGGSESIDANGDPGLGFGGGGGGGASNGVARGGGSGFPGAVLIEWVQ